jgi:hypothetical protein
MQIIIHRVNKISQLIKIKPEYGVEIDVRAEGRKLILNHEPFYGGEDLEKYLKKYHHSFIIFNIKEAGIENKVTDLAKTYGVKKYFLLDVEFPYIYRATRKGMRKIALRYSEDESLETVLKYKNKADWVWIDTNTKLPLDKKIIKKLNGFKTCLVCPERWGRPRDIIVYQKKLKKMNYKPDAVMTSSQYAKQWKIFKI